MQIRRERVKVSMIHSVLRSALCTGLLTMTCAQGSFAGKATESRTDAPIILGTGGVAGTVAPESWIDYEGKPMVRNVQQATLTPVLPEPGKASGAAVVVVPGGAFVMVAMDHEGTRVARWLADHGIAAFVLKYRLRPTPASSAEFRKELDALVHRAIATSGTEPLPIQTPPEALADCEAALRLVRARSKAWAVDPARVGVLGFSAGATVTVSMALETTPETVPAFIAPIYPPMNAVNVPTTAPPMFAVLADDDALFARKGYGLIESWNAAKKPVEFHLYQKGGHGFGLGLQGTTSMDWMRSLYRWLNMNGLLKPRQDH